MNYTGDREKPSGLRLSRIGRTALHPWKPQFTSLSTISWAPFVVLSQANDKRNASGVLEFSRQYLTYQLHDSVNIKAVPTGGATASSSRPQLASYARWPTHRSLAIGAPGAAWEAAIAGNTLWPDHAYATRARDLSVNGSSRRIGSESRLDAHMSFAIARVGAVSRTWSSLRAPRRGRDPAIVSGRSTSIDEGTAFAVVGTMTLNGGERFRRPTGAFLVPHQRIHWAPTSIAARSANQSAGSEVPSVRARSSRNLSMDAAGRHEPTGADRNRPETAAAGELILDGAELGSWVIRHLADSLAAAPMGTTGPDGRIAPPALGTALYAS